MINKKLYRAGLLLMFAIGAFHTGFIVIGGPPLPRTEEYLRMQADMKRIMVDSGGGILRSTQDFMDGFNIIVSIYLITLPLLNWFLMSRLDSKGIQVLALISLISYAAFSLTSLLLLSIGGTILSGIACLLLLLSLVLKIKK